METAKRTARPKASADTVSALERGFALLHCFEVTAGPLSNGDLSKLTGIPKPTVTRLLHTLVTLGYLAPTPEADRYRLAAGSLRLARAFLGGLDLRAQARLHLSALANGIGGTSFLAMADGNDMVVVEACRSRTAILLMNSDVGSRLDMESSALGRAYLAALLPAECAARVDAIVSAMPSAASRPPEALPLPAGTGARRRQLLAAIAETRRLGYAASIGSWHAEIFSVAVPILTSTGDIITLNAGGPAFAFPENHLRSKVAPDLQRAARAVAEEIGGTLPLQPEPSHRTAPHRTLHN
ncbi:MAG: IclR family transcriptional regulator [Lautropia sp.]